LLEGVDVAFLALPAGSAAPFVSGLLKKDIRVIDLSPDFRFRTKAGYEAVYGPHPCPELLEEAVYGLPEFFGESIQNARLVANPGCYATATLLFLYPLVKEGLIGQGPIVADAKSGFSGAGKNPPRRVYFQRSTRIFGRTARLSTVMPLKCSTCLIGWGPQGFHFVLCPICFPSIAEFWLRFTSRLCVPWISPRSHRRFKPATKALRSSAFCLVVCCRKRAPYEARTSATSGL